MIKMKSWIGTKSIITNGVGIAEETVLLTTTPLPASTAIAPAPTLIATAQR